MVTKYWLNDLLITLDKEKQILNSLRDELIKKYGDKDENGQISITQSIKTDKVDNEGNIIFELNPKYTSFIDEYNSLLIESKEIKLPEIDLNELLHVNTSDNYQLVFKYIIKKPNEDLVEVTK